MKKTNKELRKIRNILKKYSKYVWCVEYDMEGYDSVRDGSGISQDETVDQLLKVIEEHYEKGDK